MKRSARKAVKFKVLKNIYRKLFINSGMVKYRLYKNICGTSQVVQWLRLCTANVGFSSVQFSCSVVSKSLWPHEPQHARSPCPSPTPNSRPLSEWCHATISSSVVPFSSCPQSFPASGSFQMRQLFASGDQSIGVSASASVLSVNTQDWSPLGWTGWISLLSMRFLRVFSNTTVQKHQFFGTQVSL